MCSLTICTPSWTAHCNAGVRQALQLFVAVYRQHPAPALEALSWMLTPDADQGVEARVEAAEGTALITLDLNGLGGSEPGNVICTSRPISHSAASGAHSAELITHMMLSAPKRQCCQRQQSIVHAMVLTTVTCAYHAHARCVIAVELVPQCIRALRWQLPLCWWPAVMAAVARRAAGAGEGADDHTAPQLWRPTAVHNLAASLAQDSSLRVRLNTTQGRKQCRGLLNPCLSSARLKHGSLAVPAPPACITGSQCTMLTWPGDHGNLQGTPLASRFGGRLWPRWRPSSWRRAQSRSGLWRRCWR